MSKPAPDVESDIGRIRLGFMMDAYKNPLMDATVRKLVKLHRDTLIRDILIADLIRTKVPSNAGPESPTTPICANT